MFRCVGLLFQQQKSLSYMFRQFKLAGAHPDILWSIDASKAQHNGEEMAKLETLLHERIKKGRSTMAAQPPQKFFFWLKSAQKNSGAAASDLRKVECLLHPSATSDRLKEQLGVLFTAAGIHEDFTIGEQDVNMSVESLLHYADEQQNVHIKDAGALYIRAEKAIQRLRQHGVVVVVSDSDYSYLVTLPEAGFHQIVDNVPPPSQQFSSAFSGGGPQLTMKSIVGPSGEVDPEAQEYMYERGLRPFELRMSGSQAAIEGFVSAFERLERLYDVHRGRALRPGVCLVLRLSPLPSASSSSAPPHFLARDGCLVLSMRQIESWETFLLSLRQDDWRFAVEQHQQWRIGTAPKLAAQRRQLKKLADAFGFFRLSLQGPMGAVPHDYHRLQQQEGDGMLLSASDTEETMVSLLREEPAIRKTLSKYKVYSKILQKRGHLVIVPHLYSRRAVSTSPVGGSTNAMGSDAAQEEIGYRLLGDGTVYFSRHKMKVPQMLRVLRDNIKRIEASQVSYDRSTAALEHLSRVLPIDFSVDTQWKIQEETRFPQCLEKFVTTMKTHQHQIAALLQSVGKSKNHTSGSYSSESPQEALRQQLEYEAGKSLPQNAAYRKALERRYVWVVSDKLDALPTGVLYIPYNVDFPSLKRCLLPG